MIPASEALARLRDGNARFRSNPVGGTAPSGEVPFEELARGQAPFAIVLSCADSRVPPEAIFDQGFGDLFVVRVAGSIATPTQIGSVEFAVDALGAKLIVVLGHSGCGAVVATLQALAEPPASVSPNLGAIVEAIAPAVAPLLEDATEVDLAPTGELVGRAVRATVDETVRRLEADSALLAQRVADGELRILGAEYALADGSVRFLDAP